MQLPATGVAQDEDSIPLVTGSQLLAAEHSPDSIKPEVGQRPENNGKPSSSNESWNVLQEDPFGFHLANELADLREEPPLILDAKAEAGKAPGLAWEAGCEYIDAAAPRSSIKGEHVVPDECAWPASLQNGLTKFVLLDKNDWICSGLGEVQSELQPADAGT